MLSLSTADAADDYLDVRLGNDELAGVEERQDVSERYLYTTERQKPAM
jgi:hypothetical protein